jgi:hypothetical protein
MWTLVLFWLVGTTATTQAVPGFESQQACSNAFNEMHDEVTWGLGIKFIGKCVSLKEAPAKK